MPTLLCVAYIAPIVLNTYSLSILFSFDFVFLFSVSLSFCVCVCAYFSCMIVSFFVSMPIEVTACFSLDEFVKLLLIVGWGWGRERERETETERERERERERESCLLYTSDAADDC